MANKKDITKELLASSLKELMVHNSFDKITIKMITDAAGVIRPTFYNHFQDKYELLNYIFEEDIIHKVFPIMNVGLDREASSLLFRLISQDMAFYKKAFTVTGQNSFNGMIINSLTAMFLSVLRQRKVKTIPGLESLKEGKFTKTIDDMGMLPGDNMENVLVASYYAISLTNILENWVHYGESVLSFEQMATGYYYLVTHSFSDLIQEEED
jgi:probable dihydroxyacetone kinase regulator